MYDACRASGLPDIRLVSFDASKKLGHDNIYKDFEFPGIVKEFIDRL